MARQQRHPHTECGAGSRASALPTVVGFVGRSGCGKTTLLLKLLPELRSRGLRVAIVKHTSHADIETDVAGTDSRRFWDADADAVLLVAPDRVVHTRRVTREPTLDEVLAGVRDADLALLEGFKHADVDKIEVVRSACTPTPLRGIQRRVAVVTDVTGFPAEHPVFSLDQIGALARFLIDRMPSAV